ncbi:MAG: hypothetical protein ACREJM_00635, partial [Candidatus Saccharimonadales bacterium]
VSDGYAHALDFAVDDHRYGDDLRLTEPATVTVTAEADGGTLSEYSSNGEYISTDASGADTMVDGEQYSQVQADESQVEQTDGTDSEVRANASGDPTPTQTRAGTNTGTSGNEGNTGNTGNTGTPSGTAGSGTPSGAGASGSPSSGGENGGGNSSGTVISTTSNGYSVPVPGSFTPSIANNGDWVNYQQPGATGNANMVRIADPTTRYPEGYMRYYNSYGQPLGPNGLPGSNDVTHFSLDTTQDMSAYYAWLLGFLL